ncbi:MAG: SpoIIE family protein phosphatase [Leptospirales bacterium]|nr:SpoIIE family protein phosphatase [Leptospirales bacterium]
MARRSLVFLFLLLGQVAATTALGAEQGSVQGLALSAAESAWIRQHPVVIHGYTTDWPPFEFVQSDGLYQGVAADYLKLIEQRTGLHFQPQPGLNWQTSIQQAEEGRIDLLPCISDSTRHRRFLLFTRTYIDYPIVIVTRTDAPFVGALGDLNDQVAAAPRAYYTADLLIQDYPGVRLLYTDTIGQALRKVSIGEADAAIDNLAVMSQQISRMGLTNLKIAAPTEYRSEMRMAVRSDQPELRSILDKALASITAAESNAINQKWLPVRYEYGVDMAEVIRTGLLIGAGVAAAFALFYLWNRSLEREVRQRKAAEEQLSRLNSELVGQRNQLESALRTIQRDIGLARVVQQNILPRRVDGFRGLRVAALYQPAGDIGGDIYDIFEREPGLVRIFLADAMGHGVQAALVTMMIKSEYEHLKRGAENPDEALRQLNQAMMFRYQSMPIYFPAIIVDVDAIDGRLRYCSAGLGDQLALQADGGTRRLRRTAPIIGLSQSLPFQIEETELAAGETVLLFTDGIIEAQNRYSQMYGEARLAREFRGQGLASPELGLERIQRSVQEHLAGMAPEDDITVVALQRRQASAPGSLPSPPGK